jgi:hypothetical protein
MNAEERKIHNFLISEGFEKFYELYSIQKEFEYGIVQFEYNMETKKVYLSISDQVILPKEYKSLQEIEQLYKLIL